MSPHVALLRGINVGGRNAVPMKELVKFFEQAGASSVRTYIQSGNVVFDAPARSAAGIADAVREGIKACLDLDVPIILRTRAECRRAIAANPFIGDDVDPAHLHLGFLATDPTPAAAASLDPARSDVDAFTLTGRHLHLHIPGGMARTKLTTAYFDRCLQTVVTVRNWRTVGRLAEMLGSPDG